MTDEKTPTTPAGVYVRMLSTSAALRVLAGRLEGVDHPDQEEAVRRLVALAEHCDAVGKLNLGVHLATLAQAPAPGGTR